MKTILISIAAGSLLAALATAQTPRYTITDLGAVGGPPGQPSFITNNGLVNGAAAIPGGRTHAALWLVNSSLIDGALFARSQGWSKALRFLVLYWPLASSVVLLNGFRHVLSIPVEWRANWIFQITESQGRAEWMSAVERFVVAYAIAPIYLVLFPIAVRVLGWPMALRMTVLQLLVSLSIFEALFYSWQKLPFTCSYVPAEQPLVGVVAKYVALLGVMAPILAIVIVVAIQVSFLFPLFLAIFGGLWIFLRVRRREGWGEAKLMYEDLPAVVADLGIKEIALRDVHHAPAPR